MGVLSSAEGSNRVLRYQNKVDKIKSDIRKNFGDMDLVNNNRRDEIEAIVEEIERKCDTAYSSLSSLWFE